MDWDSVDMGDGTSVAYLEDGRCPYLGGDNRCTIYESRPEGCRTFDCRTNPAFLDRNPDVANL